ncbi:MAG: chorismate synthase [Desulfovibrio sp.]|uniref:chorismate synthase n=1 Tax=Desulfovibrio sp. TaxID=885 RepID=UPI001A7327E4|nr:chorismate synthase [Desulfovibrio sp.]MBD5416464.1 chorismate synthase [Desulfovibrio sp.]
MAGNTFGRVLRLTTFGESHGPGLGGVLDGCPAGLPLSEADLQAELDLRRPGQGPASTKRKEPDTVHLLSGVFEGQTTGTPIAFYIANEDQRSRDYGKLAELFRPGHADWSYHQKFGGIRDYRGGGRSSARETAARVAGGAIARKLLSVACGTVIRAACVELGGIAVPEAEIDMKDAVARPYFAASEAAPALWDAAVAEARAAGDTLGGIVRIVAEQVPAGLGEPVFDRLDATLAHALMSVGAVKGVEVGDGFAAARSRGSANNDALFPAEGADGCGHAPRARFGSNHAGGILGGISSGQDIILQAAVKPIASIAQEQATVDRQGRPTSVTVGGRHDLAAIPRIVPVLAAMTALALADAYLLQRRMAAGERL